MVLKIERCRTGSRGNKEVCQTQYSEFDIIKVETDTLNKKICFDLFNSDDQSASTHHVHLEINIGEDDAYVMERGLTIDTYRTWTNKAE